MFFRNWFGHVPSVPPRDLPHAWSSITALSQQISTNTSGGKFKMSPYDSLSHIKAISANENNSSFFLLVLWLEKLFMPLFLCLFINFLPFNITSEWKMLDHHHGPQSDCEWNKKGGWCYETNYFTCPLLLRLSQGFDLWLIHRLSQSGGTKADFRLRSERAEVNEKSDWFL